MSGFAPAGVSLGMSVGVPGRVLASAKTVSRSAYVLEIISISALHTDSKRPEIWLIFEIRHVSKHEFYSLSVFQRLRLPSTFRFLSNASWYFVCTTPKSDAFQCSAVPDMQIQIRMKLEM